MPDDQSHSKSIVTPPDVIGLTDIIWSLFKDEMKRLFTPQRAKQIIRILFLKFVYGVNYYIFHINPNEQSVTQFPPFYSKPVKCQTLNSIANIFQPISRHSGVRSLWNSAVVEYHKWHKPDRFMLNGMPKIPNHQANAEGLHQIQFTDKTGVELMENDDDDSLTSATTTATVDQHRIKDLEQQLATLQKQMEFVLKHQAIQIQPQMINLLEMTDNCEHSQEQMLSNSSSTSSSPFLTQNKLPPIVSHPNILPPPPPPPPSLLFGIKKVASDQESSGAPKQFESRLHSTPITAIHDANSVQPRLNSANVKESSTETNVPKTLSVMNDLSNLLNKGVNLRKVEVERSPGGGPLRKPRICVSGKTDGIQGVLQRALEKRRQQLTDSQNDETLHVYDGSSSTDEESSDVDWYPEKPHLPKIEHQT